ncbi:hypothetical protein TWF694_004296 [Orbilia ellipsospora]|uniref:Uncharacterized protein n=1 Tax=Orbilia ellipsospora TaxID=2528407 RepID=A0AAV9WZU2_9PEZI
MDSSSGDNLNTMATLIQIQQGENNLWYWLHVFLYDLRYFRDREDSGGRPESITDISYLGAPYSLPAEVKLLKLVKVPHVANKTLAMPLEETLNENLFRKKRVQISDFRVCAAHDPAPLSERTFDIKPKSMDKSKAFEKLVEKHGLHLPEAQSFPGLGDKKQAIETGIETPEPAKKRPKGLKSS